MRYINHKKDKYYNGDNIEKDKLMQLALNKYKICAPRTSGDPITQRTADCGAISKTVED